MKKLLFVLIAVFVVLSATSCTKSADNYLLGGGYVFKVGNQNNYPSVISNTYGRYMYVRNIPYYNEGNRSWYLSFDGTDGQIYPFWDRNGTLQWHDNAGVAYYNPLSFDVAFLNTFTLANVIKQQVRLNGFAVVYINTRNEVERVW